jgi:DNA polymerase
MSNCFSDLETRSPTPIRDGTHRYAELAEVLLWAYATDEGPIDVWDIYSGARMPSALEDQVDNPESLIWFHNGGNFDFVVLEHAMPEIAARIPQHRRRDTMVQAYCHGLPGALDTLGHVLNLAQDKRKLKAGKDLMRYFCVPKKNEAGSLYFNKPEDHPEKWADFKAYAGQDIMAMREVHRKVPMWNYRGKQLDLWHLDIAINYRGVKVDQDLARAAVRAASRSLGKLAERTAEITDGAVASTTQRDATLAYILEAHGVALPDMKADTLERRMKDENLPQAVRDLLGIRLQASMNSASKYTALLKGVSKDGRLRGLAQFRGASRTGRWAHRLFQPGNLMRPPIEVIAAWHGIPIREVEEKHILEYVNVGIAAMLAEAEDMTHANVRALAGTAVRGAIVAEKGKKLTIADLANIEGRVAAWLTGEDWKLQAFRDYDTIIGHDPVKDKPIRKGPDLYVVAYAKSFNVAIEAVTKENRQIGKVEELMFQYEGGVGAWITGAATYGIDLEAMTEAVYPVLPADVIEEAESFLTWLYAPAVSLFAEGKTDDETLEARKLKSRLGLPEKTFVACDALKRLWRRAHPAISSYWKELKNTVIAAINSPGVTLQCRKLKIRRDGAWLRIMLPSGRYLCYFSPSTEGDKIYFVGMNQYTKQWGKVGTYGGKLFENVTQAVACDQLAECLPLAEEAGYPTAFTVHDEAVTETPDTEAFTHEELSCILCSNLGWNGGLPLAAAGFETKRYYKG